MTMGPGGVEQPLKRSGNLWFVPDGSMYVYFTPVAWRHLGTERSDRVALTEALGAAIDDARAERKRSDQQPKETPQ